MNPLARIAASIVSMFAVALAYRLGPRALAYLAIAGAVLFFFYFIRRELAFKLTKAAQSAGLVKKDDHTCPACDAGLIRQVDDGVRRWECPICKGVWCSRKALDARFGAGVAKLGDWTPAAGKAGPCPTCSVRMAAGSFQGATSEVARCEPCAGYWFSRTDWVGLEMS